MNCGLQEVLIFYTAARIKMKCLLFLSSFFLFLFLNYSSSVAVCKLRPNRTKGKKKEAHIIEMKIDILV